MNRNKFYICFQYFISFMALLCVFVCITNYIFASDPVPRNIAADNGFADSYNRCEKVGHS